MSINSNYRSQFELFPGESDHCSSESEKPRPQIKDLTLSIENIIVVCIILIMSFVLFYSFGVERGRTIATGAAISTEAPTPNEEAQTVEIKLETEDFVLEATQTQEAEKEEIIQVPVEKELTDEHLFTIQVASFKLERNAQKEADRLGTIGYDSFVLPKGNYSIVCVGKFAMRSEASQTSEKLKSRYRDLLVRRL